MPEQPHRLVSLTVGDRDSIRLRRRVAIEELDVQLIGREELDD